MKKYGKEGPLPADKQLVVTEYGLDHWLAQTFNLTLDTMPPYRPPHIPVN